MHLWIAHSQRNGLFIFGQRLGGIMAVVEQVSQQEMSPVRVGILDDRCLECLPRQNPANTGKPVESWLIGRSFDHIRQALQTLFILSQVPANNRELSLFGDGESPEFLFPQQLLPAARVTHEFGGLGGRPPSLGQPLKASQVLSCRSVLMQLDKSRVENCRGREAPLSRMILVKIGRVDSGNDLPQT